ncbi:MAG: hypothetical protein WBI17_13555 [Clostridiaceae bacterium]
MKSTCTFEGSTPLFFCSDCPLFLETCCYIVSSDGYAMGAECADLYLCCKCDEDCEFKSYTNQ